MYWSFPSRHSEGYKNELNHFIDVVQGQENLSVSGKMTLAVSKIATACEESARSGKPVELTWEDSELPNEYKFEWSHFNVLGILKFRYTSFKYKTYESEQLIVDRIMNIKCKNMLQNEYKMLEYVTPQFNLYNLHKQK